MLVDYHTKRHSLINKVDWKLKSRKQIGITAVIASTYDNKY